MAVIVLPLSVPLLLEPVDGTSQPSSSRCWTGDRQLGTGAILCDKYYRLQWQLELTGL